MGLDEAAVATDPDITLLERFRTSLVTLEDAVDWCD